MATIGSLSVKLGLVTVEWDKATEQAKAQAKALEKAFGDLTGGLSKLKDIYKQLGGGLSVSALGMGVLMQQTLAFTDDIADLSKGFGITISETLAFRSALIDAGVSADNAGKMMSTLFSTIEEAKSGNDATLAKFEKLGLTFADLKNNSPYETIQKVADGFGNITEKSERIKLVKDLLGKGGIGANMEALSKGLQDGTDRFDKFASSVERVGQVNDTLAKNFDNLKIAFADLLAPFTRDGLIGPEKFLAILKGIAAVAITAQIGKIALAFAEVAIALDKASKAAAVFNLAATGFSPAGLALKVAGAGIGYLIYQDAMSGPDKRYAPVTGTTLSKSLDQDAENEKADRKHTEELSKQAAILANQLDATARLSALEQQRVTVQGSAFVLGDSLAGQMADRISVEERITQIEQKRKADLIQNKEGTQALKDQINKAADAEVRRVRALQDAKESIAAQRREYEALVQQIESGADFTRSEKRSYGSDKEAGNANLTDRVQGQYELGRSVDEANRQTELTNKRLQYEMQIAGMTERRRNELMAIYDLEARISEFRRSSEKLGTDPAIIDRRSQEMRDAGMAAINLAEQQRDAQMTFSYGWNNAFNIYAESARNAAQVAGDMFTSVTGNMSSAIDQFVRTGKLSFSSLAASIIRDLMAIQLKAQMTGVFSMLLKGFSVGGTYGPDNIDVGGGWNPARAEGGPVDGGKIGLVGEKGPELFVPKTSGTIVPNDQLTSALGGGGPSITYNGPYIASMSAIDTQSATQFLAKNKQAVWAANYSAQRSLPVSR